jgi:hypothetical protein
MPLEFANGYHWKRTSKDCLPILIPPAPDSVTMLKTKTASGCCFKGVEELEFGNF